MKLTRHNGRSGRNGTYNPKHNDRRFDLDYSVWTSGSIAAGTGMSSWYRVIAEIIKNAVIFTCKLCCKGGMHFVR